NDDGYNDYVEFKYPEMYTHSPIIKIFNLRGQKVCEIGDHSNYEYRWYGKNENGKELEPGVYIYILEVNGKNLSKGTITLIR
ncbi:gliding motility-associated C-terminal domain-containing protein, partial [candidate division KSB1 bacterium]|nr:gliding motility-associated C-terminal domain-containing protein [candidate division KSB1 bacterium]